MNNPNYDNCALRIRQGEEAEKLAWQANLAGDAATAERHLLAAEGHYAFAEEARKGFSPVKQPKAVPASKPQNRGNVIPLPMRRRPAPHAAATTMVVAPRRSHLHNLLLQASEGSGIKLLDPNKPLIDQF